MNGSTITSPVASTPASVSQIPAAGSGNSPAAPNANKDIFLQLLVAQLKYQDPDNPADGTQFVTQLAQFSQLEQSTQMVSDLDQIKSLLGANSTTGAPPPTTLPGAA